MKGSVSFGSYVLIVFFYISYLLGDVKGDNDTFLGGQQKPVVDITYKDFNNVSHNAFRRIKSPRTTMGNETYIDLNKNFEDDVEPEEDFQYGAASRSLFSCNFERTNCFQNLNGNSFSWIRTRGAQRMRRNPHKPVRDHTLGTRTGKYMYASDYTASGTGTFSGISSRTFDLQEKIFCLSYWYHLDGHGYKLTTTLYKPDTTNHVHVAQTSDTSDKWRRGQATVRKVTQQTFSLRFYAQVTQDDPSGGVAIDDVTITQGSCNAKEFLPWSAWSSCSRTCGGGNQRRQRNCPPAAVCDGATVDNKPCNTQKCPKSETVLWECDFEDRCRDFVNNAKNGGYTWIVKSGMTDSVDTGPDGDHTTGSGHYLYAEASNGTAGDRAILLSVPSKRAQADPHCLSLWYHMYGKDVGTFELFYINLNPNADDWTLLMETGDRGNVWRRVLGDISTKMGDSFAIMMQATRGRGYRGDIAIDDIKVTQGACPKSNARFHSWSLWETCTRSCGGGKRVRRRECRGSEDCVGSRQAIQNCNTMACPDYSPWSTWGKCSKTCGGGLQTRNRRCLQVGFCNQRTDESRACNTKVCRVTGSWTEWSRWSACSVSCGIGQGSRSRDCLPQGSVCDGNEKSQRRICVDQPCGGWETWGQWEPCSATCQRSRSRSCHPGGFVCRGSSTDTESCTGRACRQMGRWSRWSAWSACSVTCGLGSGFRTRSCDPNGADCDGESEETRKCQEPKCGIPDKWTNWSAWRSCSATCGDAVRSRSRSCKSPVCSGDSQDTQQCQQRPCPKIGRWSAWSAWSACSVTCGLGSGFRTRSCDPSDAVCDGEPEETRRCQEPKCQIPGRWTLWSAWSACSVTCGLGSGFRTRSCDPPDADCDGETEGTRRCQEPECLIPGRWSLWSAWSACSVTCGLGSGFRTRSCDPVGAVCDGDSEEPRQCKEPDCGRWLSWSNWGTCSATCGVGSSVRTRSCSPRGANCAGNAQEEQRCLRRECVDPGAWTSWDTWGPCSASCGEATRSRSRSCEPSNSVCQGPSTETIACEQQPACNKDNWNPWTQWSPCSVSCSDGTRVRSRSCNTTTCDGPENQTQGCSAGPCGSTAAGATGAWSEWEQWTCSVTCGRGFGSRSRNCLPEGEDCFPIEGDVETQGCIEAPCPDTWSEWSACPVTCGSGTQRRTKSCEPIRCVQETKLCLRPPCTGEKVGWRDWSEWSSCSVSCEEGVRFRSRSCRGTTCQGARISSEECVEPSCNGEWSEWNSWSGCTRLCDVGTQERSRTCSSRNCLGAKVNVRICNADPCIGEWGPWDRWSRCSASCGFGQASRYRNCSEGNCPAADSSMQRKECQAPDCPGAVEGIFP